MKVPIPDLAAKVREEYDADIILYFGPIARPRDDFLIGQCAEKKKRKNALLCISTLGGDPHAAYRIARTLQKHYNGPDGKAGGVVYAYVVGVCASAGTLLVMGANELILSPHAELGPIDVQLRRHDEVGERTSGLTPVQALEYLREEGVRLFEEHFKAMRFGEDLSFPTSVASRVAAEITSGCLGKLYEQIDPLRVAEINRALSIAEHYGSRIAKNLKPEALQKLLYDYPSHDSVIDPTEARELFEKVSDPKESLAEMGKILKVFATTFLNAKQANATYLPEPPEKHEHDTHPGDAGESTAGNAGKDVATENNSAKEQPEKCGA